MRRFTPLYGSASIAEILDILRKTFGIAPGKKGLADIAKGMPEVDRIVFFLLDGLGFHTLRSSKERFHITETEAFLRKSDIDVDSRTFPSTTSTATICCHTGLTPGEHGVLGYTHYIGMVGRVCNMLNMSPLGVTGVSILEGLNEIESIFGFIRSLSESGTLGRHTGILISADHGHTVIPHGNVIDFGSDPRREYLLSPVAGDARAPFLHLRDGAKEKFLHQIPERYAGIEPLELKEGINHGLFGKFKYSDNNFGSGHDLILLFSEGVEVMDSTLSLLDPDFYEMDMIGMHGGL